MLENRVIVTSLTTLGVVMSAGTLVISLIAAEDRSAPPPVTSAAIAQIPASTQFIAHSTVPTVEIPVVEESPSESLPILVLSLLR